MRKTLFTPPTQRDRTHQMDDTVPEAHARGDGSLERDLVAADPFAAFGEELKRELQAFDHPFSAFADELADEATFY
jgi:hypothetical protein